MQTDMTSIPINSLIGFINLEFNKSLLPIQLTKFVHFFHNEH